MAGDPHDDRPVSQQCLRDRERMWRGAVKEREAKFTSLRAASAYREKRGIVRGPDAASPAKAWRVSTNENVARPKPDFLLDDGYCAMEEYARRGYLHRTPGHWLCDCVNCARESPTAPGDKDGVVHSILLSENAASPQRARTAAHYEGRCAGRLPGGMVSPMSCQPDGRPASSDGRTSYATALSYYHLQHLPARSATDAADLDGATGDLFSPPAHHVASPPPSPGASPVRQPLRVAKPLRKAAKRPCGYPISNDAPDLAPQPRRGTHQPRRGGSAYRSASAPKTPHRDPASPPSSIQPTPRSVSKGQGCYPPDARPVAVKIPGIDRERGQSEAVTPDPSDSPVSSQRRRSHAETRGYLDELDDVIHAGEAALKRRPPRKEEEGSPPPRQTAADPMVVLGSKRAGSPATGSADAGAAPVSTVRAEGEGLDGFRAAYGNGDIYVGALDAEGSREGSGTMYYAVGGSLTAVWERNRPNGYGERVWADGSFFQGMWDNGAPHGQGRMVYSDGSIYDGAYHQGVRHGAGEMQNPNREILLGRWNGDVLKDVLYVISPEGKASYVGSGGREPASVPVYSKILASIRAPPSVEDVGHALDSVGMSCVAGTNSDDGMLSEDTESREDEEALDEEESVEQEEPRVRVQLESPSPSPRTQTSLHRTCTHCHHDSLLHWQQRCPLCGSRAVTKGVLLDASNTPMPASGQNRSYSSAAEQTPGHSSYGLPSPDARH
ncbi:Phosphatidylinositol 4-phosphate 5-kinase 8 [Diplonema papillatum]|nr:Phosphatidylinositol 4-phosphate 5-kinase 8 [Diplonema papillatum]